MPHYSGPAGAAIGACAPFADPCGPCQRSAGTVFIAGQRRVIICCIQDTGELITRPRVERPGMRSPQKATMNLEYDDEEQGLLSQFEQVIEHFGPLSQDQEARGTGSWPQLVAAGWSE